MNRVDQIVYEHSGRVRITYDALARPVVFETPDDEVSVKYADTGAVQSLTSKLADEVWEPSDVQQKDTPIDDPRLIAFARDRVFVPSRDYGVFAVSEMTFSPTLHEPIALGVKHWKDAQILATVAGSVLWDGSPDLIEFEKPSNPIFQPDEYRATNCCVPCLLGSCGLCYIGGNVASPSLCFCQGGSAMSFTIVCRGAVSYPDLLSCSFLRQSGTPADPDGCSYVPDDPCSLAGDCTLAQESTSFKPACDTHDICYRTCGSNRVACDVGFAADLALICDAAYPPCPYNDDDKCSKYASQKQKCLNYAGGYTVGVVGGGITPFRNNQVRNCRCCNIRFAYTTGGY